MFFSLVFWYDTFSLCCMTTTAVLGVTSRQKNVQRKKKDHFSGVPFEQECLSQKSSPHNFLNSHWPRWANFWQEKWLHNNQGLPLSWELYHLPAVGIPEPIHNSFSKDIGDGYEANYQLYPLQVIFKVCSMDP